MRKMRRMRTMTKQDLINRYQLNESQAEVVLDESQELIVPAGAGSGKTKTLVTKIVHLLKQGHLLDSFLVLTFTKKAANEMKARIKKELKDEGLNDLVNKIDSSDIATFDAFAYNFVKQNASYIGLDSNLELLDTSIFKIKQTEIMNCIIINIMKLNDSNDKFYQFISNYTLDTQSDRLVDNLISIYDKLVNIKPLNQFNINELIDESPLFDI